MKTKGYLHLSLTMAFAETSKLAKLIAATREFGYNVSGVYGRYLIDGSVKNVLQNI